MKILITGSSGYIGSVLTKYLTIRKYYVIGLDLYDNSGINNKYYKFYNCNITDKTLINKILLKEQPSHIIHLAYLMNPLHNQNLEREIDLMGSINIFKAADKTRSVKQFILFSSASAYGAFKNNPLWIKETQDLRPRDYRYGINKKAVEDYFNNYKNRKGLHLVTLRMCTAVGPSYSKKGGVVAIIAKAPVLLKINNRYTELQFIHEKDLTILIDKILNDKNIQGTYNLAPDSYATTKELAPNKIFLYIPLWLARFLTKLLWISRIGSNRPAAITLSTYGIIIDPKKIMNHFNYKFKYSTKDAFFKTIEERKKRGTL